jgi:dipeptidase D
MTYEQLEPRPVWQFFAQLAAIPRPSKKEDRVRHRVAELATAQGFENFTDAAGNLVIRVPAAPGAEQAPTVILQAHLDMVCEKNAGTEHDFDRDPIKLVVDADAAGKAILRAEGTTLGADNGIGVALAWAAATDPTLRRPALELLLTIDEEEGMGGAKGLEGQLLRGRRMLNLDTEEDAALYVGCAGGCDVNLSLEAPLEEIAGRPCFEVRISGLRGGHSGGDIHEGRGAATKLLGRFLGGIAGEFGLIEVAAGSKRNAIPREAVATLCGSTVEELGRLAKKVEQEGRVESFEPQLTVTVQAIAATGKALDSSASKRLTKVLAALPQGPIGMHPKIPLLVETSNNVSLIKTADSGGRRRIEIGCLSRSSSTSRLDETVAQLGAIAELAGCSLNMANRYEGWAPNVDSPLLALCQRVHREVMGSEPKVAAVHAGLECGILGDRVPGLDMISLGPRIEGAHSPDERVWVESVALSFTYLRALLTELAES